MYDFGYSNETATITAKKLIYLNIPVLLKYNFSFSQSLIAGVSISKLLNSKSNVTSTNKNDNGSILTKSSKETGYVNGFNKYDLAIVGGYENKLIKNLRGSENEKNKKDKILKL